jgi:uncharacterized membrane protein
LKQDVTLKFTPEGPGIMVTPETHTVKASDNDTNVKVMVKAAADAAIGDHNVKVEATPQSGAATSETFKVKVTGK